MKSIEDLKKIREQMKDKVSIRTGSGDMRIVVGMATCGISAGARPVLNAFVEEVAASQMGDKVRVTQTGCIGICQYEPVVEVWTGEDEKFTYVKMTPDKAKRVFEEHIKGGKPVGEYLIGSAGL
jgi:NADP-reducing hydrogenase subunit HndB